MCGLIEAITNIYKGEGEYYNEKDDRTGHGSSYVPVHDCM